MTDDILRGQLKRDADGELSPPKNIIKSVAGAYTQYSVLRQIHNERVQLYAVIEGMVSGNPPYDQTELDAMGIGYISNFNNFKGRSYVDRQAQLYWTLFNGTANGIKLWLHFDAPPQVRFNYSKIMARHLSDILRAWPEWKSTWDLIGNNLARFGLAPVHFPDEESWCFEAIDVARFIIPSESSTNMSLLTNLCVESDYTVQSLFNVYSKHADGWNHDALGDFLLYRANTILGNTGTLLTNLLDLQRRLQANEPFAVRYYTDKVRVVNMFQQEYDGGFSHYMFDRERYFAPRTVGAEPAPGDFLFFVDRQYDSIQECIILFTACAGEATIHSNLGMGHKVLAKAQAHNMLDCSVVDMGRMSSSPIVRTMATGGKETGPIRFTSGVPVDIGGAELVQNTLGANINQVVGAAQYTATSMDTTLMVSGDDPGVPDRAQGSISKGEATTRSFKEFGMLKVSTSHIYNIADLLIQQIVRRMLKAKKGSRGYDYVEEWKTRCEEDGVPKELFDSTDIGFNGLPRQFREVGMSRVAGDGSTAARIIGLQGVGTIAGSFDANQAITYQNDVIETYMGPEALDAYASIPNKDDLTGGVSVATLENIAMSQGQVPEFSPANDQKAHAIKHMQFISEQIKLTQQEQMSPVDLDKILGVAIPHMQQTLQFMAGIPMLYGNLLKQIDPQFKQVLQFAQLNRRNAQAIEQAALRKQQEDQAKTGQVMSDAQRKDYVAQTDQQRKDAESQAKLDRAKQESQVRGQIMADSAKVTNQIKEEAAQVKNDATAIGRTKEALALETPQQLEQSIMNRVGTTVSAVDFK